jgi:predicted signal transduction protein with EAL and GGDEF domain
MRVLALILLIITLLSAATARADDSTAINKLIADINAAAKADKARMLRIIVINTDVAASKLELEKSRTGLSYGDVYVAHSLAMASHKSFGQIVALKTSGQSWAKIAQLHNVSLRGSTAALKEMLKE